MCVWAWGRAEEEKNPGPWDHGLKARMRYSINWATQEALLDPVFHFQCWKCFIDVYVCMCVCVLGRNTNHLFFSSFVNSYSSIRVFLIQVTENQIQMDISKEVYCLFQVKTWDVELASSMISLRSNIINTELFFLSCSPLIGALALLLG